MDNERFFGQQLAAALAESIRATLRRMIEVFSQPSAGELRDCLLRGHELRPAPRRALSPVRHFRH